MADLTLEAAQKIVESFEKNARARDEKGRFVGKDQVKLARQLIEQNKKVTESNKTGFQRVVDATKKANKDFQEIRTLQSALKDEQSSATKAQKELVKLQQKSEDERGKDHDKQIEKQESIIKESQNAVANIESQINVTKDQLSPLQKDNLALQERKEALNEVAEGLRTMGKVAEEDKFFREEQQAIQQEEIKLRKKGDIPLSKRLELEKEKAKAQKESDSYIQKGFGSLKLGIMGLGEKFGAGAMTVGKGLLTLFGLGLLVKFLESDVWKRIREFIKGPSLESFTNIFAPDGDLDGIAVAITGFLGLLLLKLSGLGGLITKPFGLLTKAITGFVKILGTAVKMVFQDITEGVRRARKGGKKLGGKALDAVKSVGSKTKKLGGKTLDAAKDVGSKTKGFFGRGLAAAKELGGKALDKGAQVGKQVATSASKLGKDAVSGAKALVPKIAGAGKAGLKVAAGAARFAGPVGLAITAGVAAVEGVAAGVEEFKESGDAGRAMAEGLGGALSGLSFGLIDKDKVADFIKPEEALSSDQLAQAMAGGPSVGPAQFASLAGGSDAARLRELENELKEGGMTDRMQQTRLSQMKSLEAKMAKERAATSNVNAVNQDNSVRNNVTNNTHTSTPIVDRDLDFLATASP